jgi:hypothetical protein
MSRSISKAALPALGAAALALLAGCGSVSEVTKERVARSETVVKQSQQTLGNSESGAVEMQRARDHLEQAQRAVKDNKDTEAQRHANMAALEAELAVSKGQTAGARRAADELLASLEQLRREAGRSDPEQAQDQ